MTARDDRAGDDRGAGKGLLDELVFWFAYLLSSLIWLAGTVYIGLFLSYGFSFGLLIVFLLACSWTLWWMIDQPLRRRRLLAARQVNQLERD